ncbi:uncharacterized protein E0L32_012383 [Thyridium curvatum]|uniref:V-type proton ATPase subunit G n=1 Tax=Thyridium curvatum TaxID=1093900 RepID=A0A507BHG6_9PEZI|nr:uncharacterized protein E0L32_012383 [Thyridium curvatum]TPX16779.1 hypothetical protein E0L32_012383 [Thyridium curvatum]
MSAQNSAGIQTLLDVGHPLLSARTPVWFDSSHRDSTTGREGSFQDCPEGYIRSPPNPNRPPANHPLPPTTARECTFPDTPHRVAVRTKRVREARDEAKKEIDAYKAEKEAEYKQFESEHTQGNKAAEEEANKEAEAKIKEIRAAGQKNQDKVVQDLLKAVFEAKPEPPSEVAA